MQENLEASREATKITLDKISSWEELNVATLEEADEKFKEKTKEYWKEFAVSGVLQFDSKEKKQVLRPFTDLDGKSALGILGEAGIDTKNLTYVKPGEYLQGAINIDTGDKFGVVYEEPTYTAYFDHHAPGTKEVTSTAEIMYNTMADLEMLERSTAMDRVVDFVTKIDNRKYPAEEFLKSAKTILGLQRAVDFQKLLEYFKDHESPTEELAPEDFEKYGLKEEAEKQQKIVDESMAKLMEMEKEGKVFKTAYGNIVVNENNELKTGASAAYVRHEGIINYTPGKSFAVTLKDNSFNEEILRKGLGDKFQGKIIRGQMWIYNDEEPPRLLIKDIEKVLSKITAKKYEKSESQDGFEEKRDLSERKYFCKGEGQDSEVAHLFKNGIYYRKVGGFKERPVKKNIMFEEKFECEIKQFIRERAREKREELEKKYPEKVFKLLVENRFTSVPESEDGWRGGGSIKDGCEITIYEIIPKSDQEIISEDKIDFLEYRYGND